LVLFERVRYDCKNHIKEHKAANEGKKNEIENRRCHSICVYHGIHLPCPASSGYKLKNKEKGSADRVKVNNSVVEVFVVRNPVLL